MADAYAWVVGYRDGSVIAQIGPDGDTGSWRKVDVRNVATIVLEPQAAGLPAHGVKVPEGAEAFLTWRRGHSLDMRTGVATPNPAVLIAGWRTGGAGAFLFIDEHGNVLCAGDPEAI